MTSHGHWTNYNDHHKHNEFKKDFGIWYKTSIDYHFFIEK
jgi:hypothetical protein